VHGFAQPGAFPNFNLIAFAEKFASASSVSPRTKPLSQRTECRR
jgi:hypothetical protein